MRPQEAQLQTRLVTSQNKRKAVHPAAAPEKKTQTATRRKKPVGKMLFFGALSLGSYLYLFSNESLVTNTFTLGGWHAVFPVGTAFFFSFIHGAFASNFLSVLGLQAKKH